uniref:Uncharacterized protein n=1 Tax=Timema shepardi TaxID=629360 RepID=A0A7R9G1K1_TIMSH|nr:unnamed protein product [Timema shepardi]
MGSSKKHKESKKRKHHSKSRSPEKIKEKHRHHKKHHKEKKRDKLKDKTAEFASKYVDYESEALTSEFVSWDRLQTFHQRLGFDSLWKHTFLTDDKYKRLVSRNPRRGARPLILTFSALLSSPSAPTYPHLQCPPIPTFSALLSSPSAPSYPHLQRPLILTFSALLSSPSAPSYPHLQHPPIPTLSTLCVATVRTEGTAGCNGQKLPTLPKVITGSTAKTWILSSSQRIFTTTKESEAGQDRQ